MSHFRTWLDSSLNWFNIVACNLYAGLFLLLWLVTWLFPLISGSSYLVYEGELPTRTLYGALVFAGIIYALTLFALGIFKRHLLIVILITSSIVVWASLRLYVPPESLISDFNLVGLLIAFLTHGLLSRMVHGAECAFEDYFNERTPLDLPLMAITVLIFAFDSKALFWSSNLSNSADFVSFVHKLYVLSALSIVLPLARLCMYDIGRELSRLNRNYHDTSLARCLL